jgi:hypothetical protein
MANLIMAASDYGLEGALVGSHISGLTDYG